MSKRLRYGLYITVSTLFVADQIASWIPPLQHQSNPTIGAAFLTVLGAIVAFEQKSKEDDHAAPRTPPDE